MKVICSTNGFNIIQGWIGNKLFKYFTMISLAEKIGARIQIEPWLGDLVFNTDHDNLTAIPTVFLNEESGHRGNYDPRQSNILNSVNEDSKEIYDIASYCNTFYHTSYFRDYKKQIMEQISFKKEIKESLDKEFDMLKAKLKFKHMFVVNVRIGDDYAAKHKFPMDGVKNFLRSVFSLEDIDEDWRLVVCADDPEKIRNSFDEFNPIFLKDHISHNISLEGIGHENSLVETLKGSSLDFLPDYYAMTIADQLFCSESTFSYSAAMLNQNPLTGFWRVSIARNIIENFDPWNTWLIDFRSYEFNDEGMGNEIT